MRNAGRHGTEDTFEPTILRPRLLIPDAILFFKIVTVFCIWSMNSEKTVNKQEKARYYFWFKKVKRKVDSKSLEMHMSAR